jgi:hypothetical protein
LSLVSSAGAFRPAAPHAATVTTADLAAAPTDAGLHLGRAFRAGWGPGGVLAHAGKALHKLSCASVLGQSQLHPSCAGRAQMLAYAGEAGSA